MAPINTKRETSLSKQAYDQIKNMILQKELSPLDFGVVRFTVENSVECGSVLDACFRGETPGFDYTRGLFHRGVE